MAIVEELEEQIFDTITSLRNSKKQPNEDTIYCTISKTKITKSLNKETLQEALNKLVSSKKLKVTGQNHRILSAAIDMIIFTQQMTVRNQIPLVMQKLCRRGALHQILVITQTVKRRKDNTKSGK